MSIKPQLININEFLMYNSYVLNKIIKRKKINLDRLELIQQLIGVYF